MDTATAWALIGFEGRFRPDLNEEGPLSHVRIKGGRALYEQVDYDDARGGSMVRLGRVDVDEHGLKPVTRYVDPDTILEIVPDNA